MKEQAERRKEKVHITWASKLPHVITLFTLFSFIGDYKVTAPSYALSFNVTYTDCKEINDNESRDHWEIVLCCNTIPPGMKTIQAIWSFKRKRFPDGTLNKHKVRLCAHGGMQQWGVSYWETYSLVVNMLTVCLLLALCNIHGLNSKSIYFVLAFPQADLDVDTWMELPMGIIIDSCASDSRRYVLKLKKSLYGLKQATLN